MSDSAATQSPPDQPAAETETFCAYLAKQFMAKRGFVPSQNPATAALAGQCDILLSYFDGYSHTLLCLVDREAHPEKIFDLSADAVTAIGNEYRKETSKTHRGKKPVVIQIVEVGPASADASQRERLSRYKSGWFSRVQASGWIVDPTAASLWTNAHFGGRLHGASFIRKLLTSPREQVAALQAPAVAAEIAPGFPYLTAAIIAVLCVLFAGEVMFGVGPWTNLLQPSIATLIAFGGLYRPLVVDSGEWWRLFSAPLLHVGLEHLVLNGVAL